MTPLLTRLARRAGGLPSGTTVSATPLLASRFQPPEALDPAPSGGQPAPHDDHPRRQRADIVRLPPAVVADDRDPVATPGPAAHQAPDAPTLRTNPTSTLSQAFARSATPRPAAVATVAARPVPTPAETETPGPPPPRVPDTAVVRVSATPAASPRHPPLPGAAAPEHRRTHDRQARQQERHEPDVVHVRIGRVEVRAPVTAAPSAVPPAPAPAAGHAAAPVRGAPEPLSLADYLRGHREAR